MDTEEVQEGLQTRTKNKMQHPGQLEVPKATRRNKAEMAEFRRGEEEKKNNAQMKKDAVVKRIARLEEDMVTQDQTVGHTHPRSRKGQRYFVATYSLCY